MVCGLHLHTLESFCVVSGFVLFFWFTLCVGLGILLIDWLLRKDSGKFSESKK